MEFPENKKIVLFDGVCNLCNSAVTTIIKHDKEGNFLFTSLDSNYGKKLLNYLGIDSTKIDSIILFDPNVAYYTKSTAALKIINTFGGFWNFMQLFTVIPDIFRDFIYDVIAKNRYNWFGKREQCMIPTPELKSKFLS